jgi:hypothetical protein
MSYLDNRYIATSIFGFEIKNYDTIESASSKVLVSAAASLVPSTLAGITAFLPVRATRRALVGGRIGWTSILL